MKNNYKCLWSKGLLSLLFVLSMSLSFAQTTVQIGSGVTTSSFYPIYSCYGYNYSQQIYTAAEITAGGGFPGEITTLRFYYNAGGTNLATWQDWTVYLGNTTQGNLVNTSSWIPLAQLTQVFTGTITAVAGNWVDITLPTPFIYSGDNIVVAVDENSPNYSCTASWRNFTDVAAPGPRAMLYYSDITNPNPAAPPTANNNSTTARAQIQFDIQCPASVAAPTVTNDNICSGNQATLTADLGSGYSYNWYDAPGGTLVGTGSSFLTPALGSTTSYYATAFISGCPTESIEVEAIASVSMVTVTLDPIDESCTGYANGSFAIGTVDCGVAPFTYSVDGGAFGAAPTNLVSGSYSVVVQDNNLDQSSPIIVTIGTQSSVTPPDPTATSPVDACSGAGSIPLNASPTGVTAIYTLYMIDSYGDGWNGNTMTIMLNGTPVLTAGATFTTGTSATITFPVTEGDLITTTLPAGGSWTSECSFQIWDETAAVVGVGSWSTTMSPSPVVVPFSSYTLNWYDAPGGNLLGSGSPLEAVGTTVMPTSASGNYNFYVTQSNGCESNPVLVTVNVADVLVSLSAQNETCTGYANGTFSITSVDCGAAPFTFSVDGGAFGAAPTNLTAGTYSVVAQDAGALMSSPMSVVIMTNETNIPMSPTVTDTAVFACTGDLSIMINGAGSNTGSDSLLTTMAAGNGSSANMFSITSINEVDITEFAINANPGTGNYEIWYRPDDYLLTPGSNTSNVGWTQIGTATGIVSAAGTYTALPIPVGITIPAGLTYSFHVAQTSGPGVSYTNGTVLGNPYASDANIVFNQGHGGTVFNCTFSPRVFNGLISYDFVEAINIAWFDAPVGGNVLGTGSPFETVGTTVLPSAVQGSYPFYAASEFNGCYSVQTEQVTVYVDPVNVEIDAIDANCNGSNTGSFVIANVLCGVAPFTFSVNGGAFGPAPTDLVPGVYSIIVQDANLDVSATYSISIGDAGQPSNLVLVATTDQGGTITWTANGTETSWFVEWGLPGFVPGTGAQIGSSTEAAMTVTITGLNGNTNYDVYIAADCGAGQTVGDWSFINFTTDCGIYNLPFIETFEDNSETRICWWNMYEVGAADWTYNTGSSGGTVNTAYEGTLNARFVSAPGTDNPITKLISPRFDFTGQDSVALIFAHAQEMWAGDQNVTKVYVNGIASPFVEIASYNNPIGSWQVDTLFITDTTYEVAFEGINNWGYANVVDYVQFLPCTLQEGIDGATDVCRLDNVFDLNTIVTLGEDFGSWSFPPNETFLNGSVVSVGLLPSGTYNFYYVVSTPCASDTTVATLTIFGPSTAGTDGVIDVCQNQPFNLLSGLGGTVDMGGTWFDPFNNPLASASVVSGDIPGMFNYDYITSNGVCPNDTSNVVVNVSASCDYLQIQELAFGEITLYPNPTFGSVFITNSGSTEVFDYTLTDVQGRLIDAKKAAINGSETTEINLGKLEPGVYLIQIYNENVEQTFRLVKE